MAQPIAFSSDDVLEAYNAVVNNKANWLLLAYDVQPETFRLYGSGSNGLSELKSRIEDPDQVLIGFYRDEARSDGFIILNYVPSTVSGVRRARCQVHSRRIGTIFEAHRTSLTVDHLSNLTPTAIRQALATPDSVHVIQLERPPPESVDEMGQLSSPPASGSSPPPSARGPGTVFSSLLRRKKKELEPDMGVIEPFNIHLNDETPPPPPPKDRIKRSNSAQPTSSSPKPIVTPRPTPPRPVPQPIATQSRPRSNSDYTVISQSSSSSDEVVVVRPQVAAPPRSPAIKKRSVTLPTKWNTESMTPQERARRRKEQQQQRELEERLAIEEEAERQRQTKQQKEALLKELELEEEERRASLEKELKFVAAKRRQREQLDRLEDERKKREIQEKKRLDRERRLAEHRRLEQWRKDQAAHIEEEARLAELSRRKETEEHKKKIQLAATKAKNAKGNPELLSGFVTMQYGDSLVWRRRYYKFMGTTVFFYRSPKDLTQILEQVDMRGQIRALKEWYEGFEDLKAIPHAFAIDFKGDREPWSLFTDSEEEKYKLLGLLQVNGM
ncbi:ADF-H domain-containing protein [Mycena indigotica]|uniref:ADF-H domain-containing protein n=1 Tax=Mycena indigotica TaxID=2126181 RepID=A0A8H6T2G0_9AGAR|nr:ADF-H domain-containing protein [Mycena indigotica]KAF7309679.1 ADF-H domain-containing protein [Mycena indigotica]